MQSRKKGTLPCALPVGSRTVHKVDINSLPLAGPALTLHFTLMLCRSGGCRALLGFCIPLHTRPLFALALQAETRSMLKGCHRPGLLTVRGDSIPQHQTMDTMHSGSGACFPLPNLSPGYYCYQKSNFLWHMGECMPVSGKNNASTALRTSPSQSLLKPPIRTSPVSTGF